MTSFSSPRANEVDRDNGVSIEVLGRTGIRYRLELIDHGVRR